MSAMASFETNEPKGVGADKKLGISQTIGRRSRSPHDGAPLVRTSEVAMIVTPGLSGLLKSVNKHVTSWDDSGSRLLIKAGVLWYSAQTMRRPAAIFVISSS